jgi:hypothetical protein
MPATEQKCKGIKGVAIEKFPHGLTPGARQEKMPAVDSGRATVPRCSLFPAYPRKSSPLSRFSVRRSGALPLASFRLRLAMDALAVRLTLLTAKRAAGFRRHVGPTQGGGGIVFTIPPPLLYKLECRWTFNALTRYLALLLPAMSWLKLLSTLLLLVLVSRAILALRQYAIWARQLLRLLFCHCCHMSLPPYRY